MQSLITTLSSAPRALTELVTLGRTLNKRCADVLALLRSARHLNGPTEASNVGSNTHAD